VFGGHGVHCVLSTLEYVSALQSAQTSAPMAAECLPAAHCVHASDPMLALNLPATQATHEPPSGPEYPMSHWQSKMLLLESGDTASEGQFMHVVSKLKVLE